MHIVHTSGQVFFVFDRVFPEASLGMPSSRVQEPEPSAINRTTPPARLVEV